MTRLLCMADVHLGAGANYGAPGQRLQDQADVLGRIAGIAVEHAADGVLFAGDAFEGPTVPPEQLAVFADFVDALHQVGVPILAITGNGKHDAAVRDTNGMAIFDHVPGITVAARPDVYSFAGCLVATLPWVHPGRLIARAGRDVPRDEVNRLAADLLVDVARRGFEDCRQIVIARRGIDIPVDAPTILLGHWSVSGASLPAGLPVDDLREPVLSIEALEQIGFDHIVMGHIHRPQTLGTTGFYTGSPLPLNFGEERIGHGVAILHVGEREEIDFPGAEYIEIDSPRFVTIDAVIGDGDPIDAIVDAYDPLRAPLHDAIVRVRFTATSEQMRHIDIAAIRAMLLDSGARHVKVEPQIIRAQRARMAGVDEQLDEQAALAMWIEATAYEGDSAALHARARDLLEATT